MLTFEWYLRNIICVRKVVHLRKVINVRKVLKVIKELSMIAFSKSLVKDKVFNFSLGMPAPLEVGEQIHSADKSASDLFDSSSD